MSAIVQTHKDAPQKRSGWKPEKSGVEWTDLIQIIVAKKTSRQAKNVAQHGEVGSQIIRTLKFTQPLCNFYFFRFRYFSHARVDSGNMFLGAIYFSSSFQ